MPEGLTAIWNICILFVGVCDDVIRRRASDAADGAGTFAARTGLRRPSAYPTQLRQPRTWLQALDAEGVGMSAGGHEIMTQGWCSARTCSARTGCGDSGLAQRR
jgi:hypothetical protein